MLWYLHHEALANSAKAPKAFGQVVIQAPRKFAITRIMRYKAGRKQAILA